MKPLDIINVLKSNLLFPSPSTPNLLLIGFVSEYGINLCIFLLWIFYSRHKSNINQIIDSKRDERNLSDIEFDSDELDDNLSCNESAGSDNEELKDDSFEEPPKKVGLFSKIFGGGSNSRKKMKKPVAMKSERRVLAAKKAPAPKKAKKQLEQRYRKRNRRFVQQVDTNIVSICFDVLEEDAQVAAGDPVFCKKCNCVLNKYSKLKTAEEEKEELAKKQEDAKMEVDEEGKDIVDQEPAEEDDQIWSCEFWYNRYVINVEKEEIPANDTVNYVLEVDETTKKKSESDQSVIFCLDISGSMCVTTPVEGKVNIKGDRLKELQELMKFSDGSDQFFKENRNTTYISRLQCVQAAIESQIMDMTENNPNKKVGFVTFSNDVHIVGDGSEVPQVISGDKLSDYEYLKKNGVDVTDSHLKKNIGEVNEELINKLYELQETGPTALGPALLTAVSMATQGSAGSSVVLCTDGLSNIGLGAIEGKDRTEAAEFYDKVS